MDLEAMIKFLRAQLKVLNTAIEGLEELAAGRNRSTDTIQAPNGEPQELEKPQRARTGGR